MSKEKSVIMEQTRWPVAKIVTDYTRNIRQDYGTEAELAEYEQVVRENGVSVPVMVSPLDNEAVLTEHGYRTMLVVERLRQKGVEIREIPVQFVRRGFTAEEGFLQHLIRNEGKHLTPIEQATGLYKLHNAYGWSIDDIVRRSGKSAQWIKTTLELLEHDDKVRQAIKDGKIAASEVQRIKTAVGGDKAVTAIVVDAAIAETIKKGGTRATKAASESALAQLQASGAIPPVAPRDRGRPSMTAKAKAAAAARKAKLEAAKKSPKNADLIRFFSDCTEFLNSKSSKERARVHDLMEFVGASWRIKYVPFKHEEEPDTEEAKAE